jgi:glycine cleavage system H protein
MSLPNNYKYTKDHEWVLLEGDTATVGITEFAQSELGELVFVDLPSVGKSFKQGETFCVVESTKAASDVYAPISGAIQSANQSLASQPTLINSSPYTEGWIAKLTGISADEVNKLMSALEYEELLASKK